MRFLFCFSFCILIFLPSFVVIVGCVHPMPSNGWAVQPQLLYSLGRRGAIHSSVHSGGLLIESALIEYPVYPTGIGQPLG